MWYSLLYFFCLLLFSPFLHLLSPSYLYWQKKKTVLPYYLLTPMIRPTFPIPVSKKSLGNIYETLWSRTSTIPTTRYEIENSSCEQCCCIRNGIAEKSCNDSSSSTYRRTHVPKENTYDILSARTINIQNNNHKISVCFWPFFFYHVTISLSASVPYETRATSKTRSTTALSNSASTSPTRSCSSSSTITCSYSNKKNTRERALNGPSLISAWIWPLVSNSLKRYQ